jgi:hypothetical protein
MISGRPHLFIDVQHGLCNRLRAMASAAAIAERSDRTLVVVWRPDHHCEARLVDLFSYDGAVVEDDRTAEWCRRSAGLSYNHMEIEPDGRFGEPILGGADADWSGDVYVRSAYWLTGPYACDRTTDQVLRALRPAPSVLSLLNGVPRPNRLAVHIRMATGPGYEHLSYEAPENWPAARHRELTHWRQQSHMDRFVARVDALVADGKADSIFLAADIPEAYERFSARYGDRVVSLPRWEFDRSATQHRFALADLMMLTAADRFLGSSWSSFSEVASRVASRARRTEWSGVDF